MRVALVDPSLFTLPYDLALAAGLRAGGHQATLYGRRPRPADGGTYETGLVASFYPIAESRLAAALPAPLRLGVKGVDHLLSMARLRRILQARAHRPDIIHFQWLPLPLADQRLLGAFRAIAPLVLTVHDTNPFNGSPTSRVQRLGMSGCLAAFDRLIVHTEQGRGRLIAQGVPESRIAAMPHGPLAAPPELAEDRMDGVLTFLCFGKIKPYKGLDLAIEAFARLPTALRRSARLRIVGQPYMDLAPLRQLATERGVDVAIEPRFVPDAELPHIFGAGVVALFPYREIEASGVLSLAVSLGRPVVATRIGGFAESLRDGEQALLVPPDDSGALAAAMSHLLADRNLARRCATGMRALAAGQPGWEEIGRRTAALYARLRARDAKRCAA